MRRKRTLFEVQVERGGSCDNEGKSGSSSRWGVLTVGLGDRKREVKTPILLSELPNNLTLDLIDHALRETKSKDDEGKERGLDGFGLCVGYGRASTMQKMKDSNCTKSKVSAAAALGVPCSSDIVLLSQRSPLDDALGSNGQRYAILPLSGGKGKCKVTPEEFISVAATVQPDIVVALSDEISGNAKEKGKRRDKSISRSKEWLHVCQREAKSSGLVLYADVTHHVDEVETSIIEDEGIQGYIVYLDGLWKEAAMTPGYLSTILPRIAQGLPPDLPRCIHRLGHPIEVLECVASGFDIFCCGLAQALTKDGKAFCAPIDSDNSVPGYPLESSKRSRTEYITLPSSEPNTPTSTPILNLIDDCYARDSRPFLPGCECFACLDYSRAYVHHLLRCDELLGSVLLELHNSFRYRQFFQVIRRFTAENRLSELKKWTAITLADS